MREQQQPPKREQPPAPDWFLPAGCIALLAAGGAVLLGAAAGFIGDVRGGEAVLVFALVVALNPLFFAGLPLAIYWLGRYQRHKGSTPGWLQDALVVAALIVSGIAIIAAAWLLG